jgi:hypothetical protein
VLGLLEIIWIVVEKKHPVDSMTTSVVSSKSGICGKKSVFNRAKNTIFEKKPFRLRKNWIILTYFYTCPIKNRYLTNLKKI